MRWRGLIGAGLTGALLAACAEGAGAQSRVAMLDAMGAHAMQAADGTGPAGEVCVYCHTPTGPAGAAPAWQAGAPGFGAAAGASAACLGCHDGAQASNVSPRTPGRSGHGAPPAVGSSDHPVGVPFTESIGRSLAGAGLARLRSARIGDEIRWWVDSEDAPNGARDSSDIILYTRQDQGEATPYIECASCHDPHANAGDKHLRTANTRDRLCRSCHGA